MGPGWEANSQPLDLQSDTHLQSDTLPTALRVKAKRDLEMLPPTHYALDLHIKRPNYQAKLCKGG